MWMGLVIALLCNVISGLEMLSLSLSPENWTKYRSCYADINHRSLFEELANGNIGGKQKC